MPTKAANEMTAEEVLLEYGFAQEGDVFYKPTSNTETWVKVPGGWLCLAPGGVTPIAVGAEPWGRPYGETGRLQVPYRQTAKFEGVSGLHPATHPEAFEWVWPEERVHEIHAYAYTAEGDKAAYGRKVRKNEAGEYILDRLKDDGDES